MIFLEATGVLVRKTYGILKKRTMSEDFILSQVLLIAFLQSCLILEQARDRKKWKEFYWFWYVSCTGDLEDCVNPCFLWLYQWEIPINGLFGLHYLHKSNLFFTEFEFKGCIRCKISREWTLKGNRAEKELRLICRHLEDLRSGREGSIEARRKVNI